VDELKEDLEVRDGVSFYPIKDSDNGGMNPKRIERIAARIKESFDRYKHCVIIFNALDMIIRNNPQIKVKNLISIAVDLSRTKSGVVIFSTTDPTPSFIDELPEMDVNYQEADLVQSNDGDREKESSNKKNLIYELIPLFFKEISDRDPVLVVIEDLHWGDKPTYNLIQFLARDAKKEKLLIIGSYRSEEISLEEPKEGVSPFRDAIQRMSREHLFTTLSLKRFDRKNTKKMVSSMIGREIDIKEVKNLMDSTQGNPFFIIDYVRKMKDIDHPILETKPSEKLIGEELVSKRMASLEEREIEILNTSAVLSESITIENLHLILGIEIEELLDVMDTLMDLKFLVESEEKFIFEHPKVMESVYDQMGNDERSEIHKKITETFKSGDGSHQSTGEIDLAVHHFYAGNYKEALDKLITRGKRQIEDRELDPALISINMALECLEEYGVNKDTNAKWIEVLQIKGDILEEKDEMEQGLVVLRKALDIAEKNEIRSIQMWPSTTTPR
jgi:predicted ATPase